MDWHGVFWLVLGSALILVILEVIERWSLKSLNNWLARRDVERFVRDWEKGVRPKVAKVDSDFRVILTPHEFACEHPKRKREAVPWGEVVRIWYVTTSNGPWFPDEWLLLESETVGCSVPTEAQNFESIWDELKTRFPGFDYEPIIQGGADDARYLCWEKRTEQIESS